MKLFYTLVCGLVINFTSAQFSDDFGTSSAFPAPWENQTNQFTILNEELRLNASSSGASDIYLPPGFFNYSQIEIRLKVRLSFSPSDNNRLNLFIFSDSTNPQNASNSYYLRLGESGSNDAIALHGVFSGNDVELARGLNGRISSSFQLELRITKVDSLINIDLWNDTLNDYENEISYIDTSNFDLNTLGFFCKYTSSNITKFYFDEVYVGPIVYDTLVPVITGLEIVDSNSIAVYFSEEIDTQSVNFSSVILDASTSQNPDNYSYSNSQLTLHFANSFENNQVALLDLGILSDLSGNAVQVDTSFLILYGEKMVAHDLLINEIMPDPTPSNGLPNCEYIEIQNVSTKTVNINGLFIADLSSTVQFDTNLFLFPDELLLITDIACLDSFSFGKRIGINLPSLNNSSDYILFLNADSSLIDSITYQNSWHDSNKNGGGYSLEKATADFSCGSDNWFSSVATNGGTPGLENSLYSSPNNIPFQLLFWEILDSNSLALQFNKSITPYFDNALTWGNNSISSISATNYILNIDFVNTFEEGSLIEVSISNLIDCFGNTLDTLVQIIVPFTPTLGSLIINEILFNPESGGTDYIELINVSENPINLKNCALANKNDSISNFKVISDNKFILKPHDYCVISKDSTWLQNVYNTDKSRNFIQISSLPSYPNDYGEVYLLNEKNEVVDHFIYDENMHYSLLTDFENKSLERINFKASTNEKSNWNTASGNENYGTPGYENSQTEVIDSQIDFEIDSEYFTPNNDGDRDNLSISLGISEAGIYNLMVYNLEGQPIKQLIESEYLSHEKLVFWNGENKSGHLSNSGIYIFHLSYVSDSGKKASKRKTAYLKR